MLQCASVVAHAKQKHRDSDDLGLRSSVITETVSDEKRYSHLFYRSTRQKQFFWAPGYKKCYPRE